MSAEAIAGATDPLTDGPLISLLKAARFLAVDGRVPGGTVMWRFHTKGTLVNGRRVRLRVAKLGRKVVTTEAAVRAFLAELAEASAAREDDNAEHVIDPQPERTATRRERDIQQAEQRLAAAGI